MTKGDGYYKLSRLAVLKDYRHFRFGRKLVEAVSEYVRSDSKANGLSTATIRCHSQLYVKGFYAKYGLFLSRLQAVLSALVQCRFGYKAEVSCMLCF